MVWLKGIGIFVAILVFIAVMTGITLGWRYITAPIRGIVGAEEQIESAPSRISNYNHFFDLCAAVQGHEAALQAAKEQYEDLRRSGASDNEMERVRANIAGIQAQRQRAIARYNGDAAKDYTRARFLDSDLPYRLDPRAEETRCAAN